MHNDIQKFKTGRGGRIRTYDPLYPKQVRYQTAPRPDQWRLTSDTNLIWKPLTGPNRRSI